MTLLRGTVAGFDVGTYRADVWVDGSATRLTRGIAVNRAITADELTAGRRVLIDTAGLPGPGQFVLVAVWE
ncbi:hypothetical protein J0H33_03795 [bacterium]|jgi:hypothetical protein|nr:hypothetical protein [bacterium]